MAPPESSTFSDQLRRGLADEVGDWPPDASDPVTRRRVVDQVRRLRRRRLEAAGAGLAAIVAATVVIVSVSNSSPRPEQSAAPATHGSSHEPAGRVPNDQLPQAAQAAGCALAQVGSAAPECAGDFAGLPMASSTTTAPASGATGSGAPGAPNLPGAPTSPASPPSPSASTGFGVSAPGSTSTGAHAPTALSPASKSAGSFSSRGLAPGEVSARVGQRITISLPDNGSVTWSAPAIAASTTTSRTAAPSPVRLDHSTRSTTAGGSQATFTAVRPGTVVVTAHSTHGQATWTAVVHVAR